MNVISFEQKWLEKQEKIEQDALKKMPGLESFTSDLIYLMNQHANTGTTYIDIIGGLLVGMGKVLAVEDPEITNVSMREWIFKAILNHHDREIAGKFAVSVQNGDENEA